jgi:hypothetical protein
MTLEAAAEKVVGAYFRFETIACPQSGATIRRTLAVHRSYATLNAPSLLSTKNPKCTVPT